jgi:hypothetical protein
VSAIIHRQDRLWLNRSSNLTALLALPTSGSTIPISQWVPINFEI